MKTIKLFKEFKTLEARSFDDDQSSIIFDKEIKYVDAEHYNMKKFVITTTSESSDHYIYFLEHPTYPTDEELDLFLQEHASDKDEDGVYEYVENVKEIPTEFLKINI